MTIPRVIDGYLADTVYPSMVHPSCLPAVTDASLLALGQAPPRATPRQPFTLVDLGCGDGFGIIAMAAAYPEGHFIGYDLMEAHVAAGNARIRSLGLDNVEIRQGSFGAIEPDAAADYVTAHGVLSWVPPEVREALIRLARRWLKPGGVFTLSYNAMAGWLPRLAFQRLLALVAAEIAGDGASRFALAFEKVKASGMIDPAVIRFIEDHRDRLPANYFPHEYLHESWQPFWPDEVIAQMAAVGLEFVGQAQAAAQFPRFTLRAKERGRLAAMTNAGQRETALDILQRNSFRIDLYRRPPLAVLAPESITGRRIASYWSATVTEATADYQCEGPAGMLKFNNDAAHAIFRHLEAGPGTLEPLRALGEANLLNTLDVLFLSGQLRPAEPIAQVPCASLFNELVLASFGDGLALNAFAGRHGVVRTSATDYRDRGTAGLRRSGLDGLVEPPPAP